MQTSTTDLHNQRNYRNAKRTVILAAVIAILFVAIGFPFLGPIAAAICVVFLVSFIPWRLTTYGRPADPNPIVVPYLITVMLFMVHVGEEYLTEIWIGFSGLGQPMSEMTFFLVAAAIAPIFWLTGLALLHLRTEIGNWLAWVFVVAMLLGEPTHFVFPFLAEGHFGYFSGMYTSILPIIAAAVLGFLLYRDGKQSRAEFVSK